MKTTDSRERLLDAATEILWRHGYRAASVDAVCQQAGVKKGSFYWYFESKDALVLAVLERAWAERRPLLDAVFSASLSPLARFEAYFDLVERRQADLKARYGRVLGCFFTTLGNDAYEQSSAVADSVRESLARYQRYFTTTLRDLDAVGLARIEDPVAKANDLFVFMEGALISARVRDDLTVVSRIRPVALRLIGLEPHPPTPSIDWSESPRPLDTSPPPENRYGA